MTRLLFVGDTWQGSSARSLREALALMPQVLMRDLGEDLFVPTYRRVALRLASRMLGALQRRELHDALLDAVKQFRPDAVIVYKGANVETALITRIRPLAPVINVFPDYSPLVYGRRLQAALGLYDLIVSTKPYHPALWGSLYGYSNRCVFVPHGYDPAVHLWSVPPTSPIYDVALCGTWRPEYQRLMRAFAENIDAERVSVAVAGHGWIEHREELPKQWHFAGPQVSRSYGEFLRSARIVIAPVNRDVIVRNVVQPGDQDSTRTYEVAAAYCFVLHQRTEYVASVYDESTEVPLWTDGQDLANLVRRWLPDERGRAAMARCAHARAVPRYSIPARAVTVLQHVEALIERRAVAGVAR